VCVQLTTARSDPVTGLEGWVAAADPAASQAVTGSLRASSPLCFSDQSASPRAPNLL